MVDRWLTVPELMLRESAAQTSATCTRGTGGRLSCRECGATVEVDQVELHARWHARLKAEVKPLLYNTPLV